MYRVTPKKTEPINFFISSTKIKQNNSNFVHFCLSKPKCFRNLRCFAQKLWSTSYPEKKEKARIKFMNFSQKYMSSVFWVTLYIRGAFNKFPGFICTGILNCRRLLKIHYLIAIHLMMWLTNQFLWFQVQMNSYSRNWNTPY